MQVYIYRYSTAVYIHIVYIQLKKLTPFTKFQLNSKTQEFTQNETTFAAAAAASVAAAYVCSAFLSNIRPASCMDHKHRSTNYPSVHPYNHTLLLTFICCIVVCVQHRAIELQQQKHQQQNSAAIDIRGHRTILYDEYMQAKVSLVHSQIHTRVGT